jgi:hypothetical protein
MVKLAPAQPSGALEAIEITPGMLTGEAADPLLPLIVKLTGTALVGVETLLLGHPVGLLDVIDPNVAEVRLTL